MDEPKPKKLTRKQERLARAVVRDPQAPLSEIGRKSGYSGDSNQAVAGSAWRTLQIPHVKARIRELMELNPKLHLVELTKRLEEGLGAKETKFFAHEGVVTDKRETVDYGTRHRYLETALELHGATEKVPDAVVNNFFTKDAIETFVVAFKRRGVIDVDNP